MRVEALRHLPIETPRLRLRPLRLEDLDAMARLLGDAETMRHLPRPLSAGESREWIERNLQRYQLEGTGLFAVERRDDGAFLGDTGLVVQAPDGVEELEVGYHVLREHWHHGYATEAAGACVSLALGPLGLRRVVALVRPENQPSRRVAERLGMTVERRVVHRQLFHDLFVLSQRR